MVWYAKSGCNSIPWHKPITVVGTLGRISPYREGPLIHNRRRTATHSKLRQQKQLSASINNGGKAAIEQRTAEREKVFVRSFIIAAYSLSFPLLRVSEWPLERRRFGSKCPRFSSFSIRIGMRNLIPATTFIRYTLHSIN